MEEAKRRLEWKESLLAEITRFMDRAEKAETEAAQLKTRLARIAEKLEPHVHAHGGIHDGCNLCEYYRLATVDEGDSE